jgi:hypothetical protein
VSFPRPWRHLASAMRCRSRSASPRAEVGSDQLDVVDGCIMSDVPADRPDNNGSILAAGTRATDPAAHSRHHPRAEARHRA